ncbi:TcC31.12 [Trypanosoma grayi]|uniref:TcC31.12 n=1 Tax=Trypanosoma grayi TaxID=71804 RepID=UPI0004F4AE2F|nr:TcC31.12 [Trypanosoma grayi]KEG06395.1 TcC31.12 [Trypanosoma grayi]
MQKGKRHHHGNGGGGTAHNVNHKRHGKPTPPIRHDSTFYQKRGTGACSRSGDRTRSRPSPAGSVGETRRPSRATTQHSSLHRALGRPGKQVGTPDGTHVDEISKWAMFLWAYPVSRKEYGKLFEGHSILRRTDHTRVADKTDERKLPLQQVDVDTPSLHWIRSRLNSTALERFNTVWDLVQQPAFARAGEREPLLRMTEEDAQVMKKAGIIQPASKLPTTGWVVPFTVVEEKQSGPRRRFIAWPKAKNEQEDYEALVPLGHISQYLGAVYDETAAIFDLKASFFQVGLPAETRGNFRCRTEKGELVEFTRLPMGYKCSPEIVHTITRVLAGDPEVVKPRFAAPPELTLHVWIDNLRITGPRKSVELWGNTIMGNMRDCGATVGEHETLTTRYEFIGVCFNHTARTVSLSDKTLRKLKSATPLHKISVEELECLTSRMMYAAGVQGGSLFRHYFFLKMVRRRLSRLNRGLVDARGPAALPPFALTVGQKWLDTLLQNNPVYPPRALPTSGTLVPDASLYGWGALLFKGSGEVWATGGAWEKAPHIIAQAEARAVGLALLAFKGNMPITLHICIDNTTVMHIMKKGNTHSDALVGEAGLIDRVLRDQGLHASWDYVASKNNPADGISRGAKVLPTDIAKGWDLRRGAREAG